MIKKLTILCLLLFVFSTALVAQKYSGQSWSSVKAKGSGTLSCVYYETPALVFKGSDGNMQGVCVDIVDEFAKHVKSSYGVDLSIKYVAKEQVFTKFISDIRDSKNVMGICNTSITEERKQFLDFSPPYMNNPSVLLSSSDAPRLNSLDELQSKFAGFKALVVKGSTHENFIQDIKKQHFPSLVIEYENSGSKIEERLDAGEKMFTLIDFTEYYDAVKNKLDIKRHNIPLEELEDQLGFIFPKNCDWTPVWNEFLTKEFKAGITYKKIIADNLGTTFVSLIR